MSYANDAPDASFQLSAPEVFRFVEPICHGLEHVPFNAAFISLVADAFPGCRVLVYAERHHLEELKSSVTSKVAASITWTEIRPPARRSEFLERLWAEITLIRRLDVIGPPRRMVTTFLSATPSTIYAAKLLQATRQLRGRVQVVLHGGASDLVGWRSRNPLIRIGDLRSAMSIAPDLLEYVVLEHEIARRIDSLMPRLLGKVLSLPHPLPSQEVLTEGIPLDMPIRVGFLGLATTGKGFPAFQALAHLAGERSPGLFEFHAIGSWPFDAGALPNDNALASLPTVQKIPRDEYLSKVRSLHYVCLPYTGDHYQMTASGVLMDAIAQLKPILAFRTPAVCELFSRHKPGFLCADVSEMAESLREVAERQDTALYDRQVADMAALQQERSLTALAGRYCELLGGARSTGSSAEQTIQMLR